MLSREVKFAIIGYGGIGAYHAGCIQSIENAKLVAVADIVEEKAKAAAEKHGCAAYTDYREMLEKEDIEVVNVTTWSGVHGEVGTGAAKAGKHVLSEKPIDVTLESADRFIAACQENKVKLGVIFQNRLTAASRRIRQALDEGRFGKLFMGDAYIKWYRAQSYYDSAAWRGTWLYDGGALMNQCIHYVDLLQWFMGPVESVFGHIATQNHTIEAEDIGVAVIRFKNGAMGVIEGTTNCQPGFAAKIEIHGSGGSIAWEDGNITRWDFADGKDEEAAEGEKASGSGAADPMAISTDAHKLQIERFAQAVIDDTRPDVTGEDARKSLEIVRAIYTSSETGQMVKL